MLKIDVSAKENASFIAHAAHLKGIQNFILKCVFQYLISSSEIKIQDQQAEIFSYLNK